MTEPHGTGAWAIGLATFAGERMLDAWFPEPHLSLEGAPSHPGTREIQGALAGDLASAARGDDLRGVRVAAIATVLAVIAVVLVLAARLRRGGCSRRRAQDVGGAIDDLVELTAIEPDATALRTEVDLDPFA